MTMVLLDLHWYRGGCVLLTTSVCSLLVGSARLWTTWQGEHACIFNSHLSVLSHYYTLGCIYAYACMVAMINGC